MKLSSITFNGNSEFTYSFKEDLAKKINDENIISSLFLQLWEILSEEKVLDAEATTRMEYGEYEVKLFQNFGTYLESLEIGIESGYGIHGGTANWKFNMLPAGISVFAETKLDMRTGGYIRLNVKTDAEKLFTVQSLMEKMLP